MAELNTNVRVDKHGNVHINKKNRIRRFGVADFILLFFLTLFGILILYPFYNAFLSVHRAQHGVLEISGSDALAARGDDGGLYLHL